MSSYYMLGAFFATTLTGMKYVNFYNRSQRTALTLALFAFLSFIGALIGTLNHSMHVLTTFISFGIGLTLFTMVTLALNQALRVIEYQNLNPVAIFILGACFTLGGSIGALVTGFGDFIHYMNRDIPDWVYSAEGYIIFMVVFGYIMQMVSTKYTPAEESQEAKNLK